MFDHPKPFKKLEKIGLKHTKIAFAFLDLGLGFGGSHHSNPIFMAFPKWYNTYSPHLTWRLSLFFRRVERFHTQLVWVFFHWPLVRFSLWHTQICFVILSFLPWNDLISMGKSYVAFRTLHGLQLNSVTKVFWIWNEICTNIQRGGLFYRVSGRIYYTLFYNFIDTKVITHK